jgi:hypothetical protein
VKIRFARDLTIHAVTAIKMALLDLIGHDEWKFIQSENESELNWGVSSDTA